MMVVVRRRSDGKYFPNHGGSRGKRRKPDWVDDLSEVKPFRGVAGVRSSFSLYFYWGPGWEGHQHFKGQASTIVDECCRNVKISYRGVQNACEHYKAKRRQKINDFYRQYEVLEVKMTIGREVEPFKR